MDLSEMVSPNFICFQQYLYINGIWLADNLKIPSGIIETGAQAYFSACSTEWKYIVHQGNKWFDYNCIPVEIIIKYHVPLQEELIKDFKKSLPVKTENKLYQNEMLAIQIALNHAEIFTAEFAASTIQKDKITGYCNSYAVLLLLQQFTHLKIYEQFNLYQAVADSNFSFQTRSLNHFYAKTKDIKKYGLQRSLLHKGIYNKNASKILDYHQELISHFYREGKKLSQRDIFIKVNTILKSRDQPEIGLSTVKQILLNTYRKNLDDINRNGEAWMKNNLLPFLIREEPEYPCDHWQIDATRLQIFCKDEKKQGSFYG